ncbi:MAG: transcription elongation factor GreA [Bernardetiaceae bacterium]
MATQINYYTKEGLQKLKDELHYLKTEGRRKMAEQIAEARDKGDLRENAEYDAAKEAQGLMELKIARLEQTLASARLIDESKIDTSKIAIFSKVHFKNIGLNKAFTYTLVAEEEANLKQNKISVKSPIGQALLGHKAGDVFEIVLPRGKMKVEILDISR